MTATPRRGCSRYYEELATRFPGGFEVGGSVAATEANSAPRRAAFSSPGSTGTQWGAGLSESLTSALPRSSECGSTRRCAGSGVGRGLLAGLESAAARLGYLLVRLDTSSHLPEAVALYRSSGYAEIPSYNNNLCAHHWFEKSLGSKAHAGTDANAEEPTSSPAAARATKALSAAPWPHGDG